MKRILLATDGSDLAQNAAKFLAHLPHRETIELTVVSALYVPGRGESYFVGDWTQVGLEREQKSAEEAFAEIENLFSGANVRLNQVTREGHPGETIVSVAKEVQPELVVIGATGHSAISRMLLGSTSDYVATHAPCSVLVVRPTDVVRGERPLRVAIGYEPTGPAQAAVEEFAEFDWGKETDVKLVSVRYVPGFYDIETRKAEEDLVHEAVKQLHKSAPLASGQVVESDHIGEGLVNFVEANDTDLVVVGETPRTRLGRILMGSMTRFVLRHAPCSVWITRNRMLRGVEKESQPATSVVSPS